MPLLEWGWREGALLWVLPSGESTPLPPGSPPETPAIELTVYGVKGWAKASQTLQQACVHHPLIVEESSKKTSGGPQSCKGSPAAEPAGLQGPSWVEWGAEAAVAEMGWPDRSKCQFGVIRRHIIRRRRGIRRRVSECAPVALVALNLCLRPWVSAQKPKSVEEHLFFSQSGPSARICELGAPLRCPEMGWDNEGRPFGVTGRSRECGCHLLGAVCQALAFTPPAGPTFSCPRFSPELA